MKHQIGREVYTLGRSYWTRMKWGRIVAIGDTGRHYIVRYADGRKAWIKAEQIFIWR